jgi:hypothetical protein
LAFDEFAFEWVVEGRLGHHKRGNCTLESWITLPVGSKVRKGRFKVALFRSTPEKKAFDGFVEQLIYGTPLDLAEVFQSGTLFCVNP